jgi:hypothetical protein
MKPKVVKGGDFTYETGLEIPAMTRATRTSETALKLASMPVGASFLEKVEPNTSIKDKGERDKAHKEACRTVSNRLSGAIRRFKTKNEGFEFATRVVNDAELGQGVRVWRVEAAAAK